MKCSVIIPTWHRPAILRKTLDSLGDQTESEFEVVVVVDGDDPETRSLADVYKSPYRLRWIFHGENKGLPAARNTGAVAAETEILLFLDDDAIPAPDWIHHHLRHHRPNREKCEIGVYGRVIDKYAQPPASHTEQYLRDSRPRALAFFEACAQNQSLAFSKIVAFGLNTSISREAFFAFGGFDPYLNFVDEDADFGARLYNHGVQFKFEPAAVVYHQDTKDAVNYHYSILNGAGRYDVYRRRNKGQINGRLQLLAQMHRGSFLRRLIHRMAWYFPWMFRLAAFMCRRVTDTTGSKLSYHIWFKTGVAEYWRGVRSSGETLDSLRDLYSRPVPIVMLHSVATPTEQNLWSYYISPARFSRFMLWIKRAGYKSASLTEWSTCTSSNRRVILTFDDAYDDFLSDAFPALQRLGYIATVFVVVDRIGKTNDWDVSNGFRSRSLLTVEQIRDLHRLGVQFGSHTLTHPRLTSLSNQGLEREVTDSKRKLEDLIGAEVPCFSYPWGAVDGRVRGAVARAGYKVAVMTKDGQNRLKDPLCLSRVNLCETDTLLELALKLATGKDFRQRTKDYLVQRGLYQEAAQMGQNESGTGENGVFEPPSDTAGIATPRVTNSDR